MWRPSVAVYVICGVITKTHRIFDLVLIFGAEKNLVRLVRLKICQKDQLVGGAYCNERDASLNLRLCVFRRLPAIEVFSCRWCFIPTDTSHLEDCQNRILQSRVSQNFYENRTILLISTVGVREILPLCVLPYIINSSALTPGEETVCCILSNHNTTTILNNRIQ